MQKNYISGESPVAFIAKNKQRIKQYGNNTVYLKNNDEFQVELFNPTKSKVLAKIEVNGESIGSGIILRPGERVFLERYLDVPKKFKFETYTVNENDSKVKKAIEDNGEIIVKFYKEILFESNYTIWSNSPCTYTTNTAGYGTIGNLGQSSNISLTSVTSPLFDTGVGTSFSVNSLCGNECSSKSMIETGRVEKGSYSDQKFESDYSSFNLYHTWQSEWKILPESRKAITADELVVYCSNCGRKKRPNERYCPSCGKKF